MACFVSSNLPYISCPLPKCLFPPLPPKYKWEFKGLRFQLKWNLLPSLKVIRIETLTEVRLKGGSNVWSFYFFTLSIAIENEISFLIDSFFIQTIILRFPLIRLNSKQWPPLTTGLDWQWIHIYVCMYVCVCVCVCEFDR